MLRCLLWAIAAAVRPKILLIADNLCLRQQLLVLKRQKPRPRLKDADRRFWVLACHWFLGWQSSVLIVKPKTVLRWHRHGWRTYWRRRSSCRAKTGRRPIAPELRTLIRRMASENLFGASVGSRRNYPASDSKSPPERSPSTCVEHIVADRRHAGGHS
jgi:putative transposase